MLKLPEGFERERGQFFNEEYAQRFVNEVQERTGGNVSHVEHHPQSESVGEFHVYAGPNLAKIVYEHDVVELRVFNVQQQHSGFEFHFG